jgi:hypothetical protein
LQLEVESGVLKLVRVVIGVMWEKHEIEEG